MALRKILAIAAFGFFLVVSIPYRSDLGWIDPVTGSTKTQIQLFGIPVRTTVTTSSLERWIIRREGGYASRWGYVHNTGSTPFGRSFSCGPTPEIFNLRAGEMNDELVRTSTDEQFAAFVRVMRTGTIEEKTAAAASAFGRIIATPRRGAG